MIRLNSHHSLFWVSHYSLFPTGKIWLHLIYKYFEYSYDIRTRLDTFFGYFYIYYFLFFIFIFLSKVMSIMSLCHVKILNIVITVTSRLFGAELRHKMV